MKKPIRLISLALLLATLILCLIACELPPPPDKPVTAMENLRNNGYTLKPSSVNNGKYEFLEVYAYLDMDFISIAYFDTAEDARSFFDGMQEIYTADHYTEAYGEELQIGISNTYVWVGTAAGLRASNPS